MVFYALQLLHDHPLTGSEDFDEYAEFAIEQGLRRTSNDPNGDLKIISQAFRRHGMEFKDAIILP
jgi:hypothetical protein